MYNVKIINYAENNEIEYRFFENPIKEGDDDSDEIIVDDVELEPESELVTESPVDTDNELLDIDAESNQRSINESLRRAKQMIYMHARANVWDWFVTYTFDPDKIDSYDYDTCYKSISNHLKYIRKNYCPDMRYIVVPELHQSGRYHFHALMSNIENLSIVDSGKHSHGKTVYNIDSYKLGFTTAVRIADGESARTANYLTKYISKGLTYFTKGRQRYLVSQNLIKPEITTLNLDHFDLVQLRTELKERSVSTRTVGFEIDGFSQTVDYINIKQKTKED